MKQRRGPTEAEGDKDTKEKWRQRRCRRGDKTGEDEEEDIKAESLPRPHLAQTAHLGLTLCCSEVEGAFSQIVAATS